MLEQNSPQLWSDNIKRYVEIITEPFSSLVKSFFIEGVEPVVYLEYIEDILFDKTTLTQNPWDFKIDLECILPSGTEIMFSTTLTEPEFGKEYASLNKIFDEYHNDSDFESVLNEKGKEHLKTFKKLFNFN